MRHFLLISCSTQASKRLHNRTTTNEVIRMHHRQHLPKGASQFHPMAAATRTVSVTPCRATKRRTNNARHAEPEHRGRIGYASGNSITRVGSYCRRATGWRAPRGASKNSHQLAPAHSFVAQKAVVRQMNGSKAFSGGCGQETCVR